MKTVHQIIADVSLKLVSVENSKKAALKKFRFYMILLIFALIDSFILAGTIALPPFFQLFEMAIIGLILFGFYKLIQKRSMAKQNYKSSFKDIVMPAIFEGFDLNVEYRKDYFIQQEEFMRSQIYQFQPCYYFGEDYVKQGFSHPLNSPQK